MELTTCKCLKLAFISRYAKFVCLIFKININEMCNSSDSLTRYFMNTMSFIHQKPTVVHVHAN